MAKFITGITSQKEFPREDLTPGNARILAMMLSSGEFFNTGHDRAEELFWFYRAGHLAMLQAGTQIDNRRRIAAFDQGIGTYEAVSLLVRPVMPELNTIAAHANFATVSVLDRDGFYSLIEEAGADMASLPNTREVVVEVGERFHQGMSDYAIAGAALARQLELYAVA